MIKILYLFTNKNSASFIFYKNSLKKEKKLNIKFSNSNSYWHNRDKNSESMDKQY